jgi:hypothetical protein
MVRAAGNYLSVQETLHYKIAGLNFTHFSQVCSGRQSPKEGPTFVTTYLLDRSLAHLRVVTDYSRSTCELLNGRRKQKHLEKNAFLCSPFLGPYVLISTLLLLLTLCNMRVSQYPQSVLFLFLQLAPLLNVHATTSVINMATSLTTHTKEEQCVVIRFLWPGGVRGTETHHIFSAQYRDGVCHSKGITD